MHWDAVRVSGVACVAVMALLGAAPAAEEAEAPAEPPPREVKEPGERAEPPAPEVRLPPDVYVPPPRASPRVRIGAATRAFGKRVGSVEALAPDHIALTTSESPQLAWFVSGAGERTVEVVLRQRDAEDPLLSVVVPAHAGIQTLDLSKHDIRLERERDYRWLVALVMAPEDGTMDKVASGGIRRVAAPAKLEAALREAAPGEAWRVYLKNGIWYDGLEALSAQIDAAPDDTSLRDVRRALFRQVGLPHAAVGERAGSPR